MESILLEVVKSGSPLLVLSALLTISIYALVKREGSKISKTKSSDSRDKSSEKTHSPEIADLLETIKTYIRESEEKKATTARLFGRVDTITENLMKINENLAQLNGMLTSLQRRVEYLESHKGGSSAN